MKWTLPPLPFSPTPKKKEKIFYDEIYEGVYLHGLAWKNIKPEDSNSNINLMLFLILNLH